MFSMGDGGEDARSRDVTGGDSARGEAARPTGTHGEPVAVEHAKGSNRIPTIPPEDEVLELDDNLRKTEKMSASHFRALLGPTVMLAHMPDIPAPRDTLSPPIEHEEVASSNLMEAALAQLKAGAKIRLKSETDAPSGVDLEEAISRRAPSTLPISNKRLAEITSTADTRPAISMPPLQRPAEGTPSPADLLAAKQAGEQRGTHLEAKPATADPKPTVDAKSATSDAKPTTAETTADAKVAIADLKPAAPNEERRPMQRMQRLKRFESEEPVDPPRRSDTKIIVAACIVIVASVATIMLLLLP